MTEVFMTEIVYKTGGKESNGISSIGPGKSLALASASESGLKVSHPSLGSKPDIVRFVRFEHSSGFQ